MLFFNGRLRSTQIYPVIERDQPHPHKIGHSCIITSSLSLVTGLLLIAVGAASKTKNTTLIGAGIISICVGFFLCTLICCYGQLKVCYLTWTFGPSIVPSNAESSLQAMTTAMSIDPTIELPTIDKDGIDNYTIDSNICRNAIGGRKY